MKEYTSKTCGCFGHIHQKLGGSKVFRCPSCPVELDRDINDARPCNMPTKIEAWHNVILLFILFYIKFQKFQI
ncbi:hypothetical protein Glove_180g15 [Diversispora epigaea]|uniref:Cas12f1-like TNB domain-containing protein n=1 Tax=Diversispora epigaea TaxID=1348612 RepID=A0A397IXH5_9GLOM|nr:hypothetical protein Glove_180g15 [Diversispora epigaea]